MLPAPSSSTALSPAQWKSICDRRKDTEERGNLSVRGVYTVYIGLQLTALYCEGAHGGVEGEDVEVSLAVEHQVSPSMYK